MSRQYVYGQTPVQKMRRSHFDLSHSVKTSMSLGRLYPIDVCEILPGDTFKCDIKQVARISSAFLRPVMDNCYIDVYSFFVPNRLTYEKWKNTMGENSSSKWASPARPPVPTLGSGQTCYSKTVGDYLGIPLGSVPMGVNFLPFRAFALIYDEWFRNENVTDPILVQKGEYKASVESLNNNPWSPTNYTGQLPFVNKHKDYFTSALPAPQKGESVPVGIVSGLAPVLNADGTSEDIPIKAFYEAPLVSPDQVTPFALYAQPSVPSDNWTRNGGADIRQVLSTNSSKGVIGGGSAVQNNPTSLGLALYLPSGAAAVSGLDFTVGNVNDLRLAFALQKMLEKDSRYGTRYREYILGHFAVSNGDARMQVPEYLGGARMPINVQQVPQTNTQNGTDKNSPLASLGAYSLSNGRSRYVKSFTEHGFILTVACIRQFHTYQQGLERFWFRSTREDYYDPLFANLGEQPIWQQEIFMDGTKPLKQQPFGYQEAWADYRTRQSRVSGEMRSGADNTLDIWHFADAYQNAPVLSSDFIQETSKFFDRTVAVPSQSQDNFILDFWFQVDAYREMPTYSIPGLIDHH